MDYDVAHLKTNYLGLTETFIYSFLAHANQFKPFVITNVAQNLEAFPIACSYLIKKNELKNWKQNAKHAFFEQKKAFFTKFKYPICFENLIKEKKCRILHAHFGMNGYRSLNLKKRLNLPLVTSFYGIDASRFLRMPRRQPLFKRLFEEGDLFLVLGKDMAERLHISGCPSEKIHIQHLGVNLNQIPFIPRKFPQQNQRIVLLYCGRLVKKKGIFYALNAFAQLSKKWASLEFRIVGDGPLREDVNQRIEQLHLQNRVILRGALSHAETLMEMRRAHLFILPCLTAPNGDMEGTPTVLMEAQASGLPIISTSHADIPEVVLHKKTGLLCPEHDQQTLTSHLGQLLDNPQRWSIFGQAGRLHVEQHYNIHHEILNLETHYTTLIEDQNA